jgi:AhpD family alkylhydroperoxidase
MARIPLPPGDGTEATRALSLRPDLARGVAAYADAVWHSSLDWRLHELVRMQVALRNQCEVCMQWRTPEAVAAGVTEELLAHVEDADNRPEYTAAERVALEYTRQFCTDNTTIDDDLLDRLGQQFDTGEIVELTLVIAKYLAFGRFNQVLGLDQACALPSEAERQAWATQTAR